MFPYHAAGAPSAHTPFIRLHSLRYLLPDRRLCLLYEYVVKPQALSGQESCASAVVQDPKQRKRAHLSGQR